MDDVPFFYVRNEDEGTNTAAVHNFITPLQGRNMEVKLDYFKYF